MDKKEYQEALKDPRQKELRAPLSKQEQMENRKYGDERFFFTNTRDIMLALIGLKNDPTVMKAHEILKETGPPPLIAKTLQTSTENSTEDADY